MEAQRRQDSKEKSKPKTVDKKEEEKPLTEKEIKELEQKKLNLEMAEYKRELKEKEK